MSDSNKQVRAGFWNCVGAVSVVVVLSIDAGSAFLMPRSALGADTATPRTIRFFRSDPVVPDFSFTDTSVRMVLLLIAQKGKLEEMSFDKSVEDKLISVDFQGLKLSEVFDRVLQQTGLQAQRINRWHLIVGTPAALADMNRVTEERLLGDINKKTSSFGGDSRQVAEAKEELASFYLRLGKLTEARKLDSEYRSRCYPVCPNCRSNARVVPIRYGLLPPEPLEWEEEGKCVGEFERGGCSVSADSPDWSCNNCYFTWLESKRPKCQRLGRPQRRRQ